MAAEPASTGAWAPATALNHQDFDTAVASLNQLAIADSGIDDEDPVVEARLFKNGTSKAGDALSALNLTAHVDAKVDIHPITDFSASSLHPIVIDNIRKCGFEKPTVVQSYCLPAIASGADVLAVSQTGSGKTAAYLAPIISSLMGRVESVGGPRVDSKMEGYDPELHKVCAEPLVLIVCPTRELALQIFEEARRLGYRSRLRPVCAYGGIPLKINLQQLGRGCDMLIGTPGRLKHLLSDESLISLTRLKYTVLDEADTMLQDTDWEEDLNAILRGEDRHEEDEHHFFMFSATFSKEARKLAREYLEEDFVRISVGRAGSSHVNVSQDIIYVEGNRKDEATLSFLNSIEPDQILIFCNSVAAVERLDDHLHKAGIETSFMHSGRSQWERHDALDSFIRKEKPILISTSVVARGIDFADVAIVINFDLPSPQYGGIDEYVHRIGRTGRIGHRGRSVSFFNDRDAAFGPDLVNLLLETGQPVPDFLEEYKPEGGQAVFKDDTDDEDNEDGADGHGDFNTDADQGGVAPANWGSGSGAQENEPAPVLNW